MGTGISRQSPICQEISKLRRRAVCDLRKNCKLHQNCDTRQDGAIRGEDLGEQPTRRVGRDQGPLRDRAVRTRDIVQGGRKKDPLLLPPSPLLVPPVSSARSDRGKSKE